MVILSNEDIWSDMISRINPQYQRLIYTSDLVLKALAQSNLQVYTQVDYVIQLNSFAQRRLIYLTDIPDETWNVYQYVVIPFTYTSKYKDRLLIKNTIPIADAIQVTYEEIVKMMNTHLELFFSKTSVQQPERLLSVI